MQATAPAPSTEGSLCGMCAWNLKRWVVKANNPHHNPCPCKGQAGMKKPDAYWNGKKFDVKAYLRHHKVFGPNWP